MFMNKIRNEINPEFLITLGQPFFPTTKLRCGICSGDKWRVRQIRQGIIICGSKFFHNV